MNFITSLLGYPLGWIMWLCYQVTNNYAFSLFIFTVITRIILVPFSIKQQKSTVKMTMLKPEMDEIQKKYANNKTKLNEELMKLYSKEGYNPTSGCLPMLIQFPILFGLIDVIYKPLTHILRLSAEEIAAGTAVMEASGAEFTRNGSLIQLDIIKQVQAGAEGYAAAMGTDAVEAINTLRLYTMGMDLTLTPSLDMFKTIFSGFNPVLLIPIFAGLTSLLMSIVTTRMSSATMEGAAAGNMKAMMYTMPLFSTFFTFSVPAGVGLYWCFSNIIGMLNSMLMNKFYNPKEAAAKARAEMEERREAERLERIEAKKKDPNKGLSQKEINRRKLAEARKRDALKYGESYVDVKDSDLM